MNPEDRALMLAQVGVPTDLAEKALDAPVEDQPEVEPAPKVSKKKASKKEASNTGASTLEQIIAKAGPSKELALDLCDQAAQAHFDAGKISKVEAARRGLDDRKAHNQPLWAEAQKLRDTLKSGVRKHYEQRTVAAKIKATGKVAQDKREAVSDDEVEAFLASEAFAAVFAKFRQDRG